MSNSVNTESIRLLTKIIKQHTRMCNSIISKIQESEHLSVDSFSRLNQAKHASLHISRATNMLEYLLGLGRSADELLFETFDIKQLATHMSRTIEDTLSGFVNLSISCTYKLKKSSETITVDQTRLELIIFNILYYCLNNPVIDINNQCTIELNITESPEDYIFRIKNIDVPPLKNPFDKLILSDSEDMADSSFTANLNTVSLLVARKLADGTKYKMSYKRYRGENRYELAIPKQNKRSATNEPILYQTNTYALLETFSDIFLKLS